MKEISRQKQPIQTNHAAFSWSGRQLFLTSGDGSVKIVDYPSLEPLHSLKAHPSSCYVVEVSPDGKRVATGGSDSLITLWDTDDWICDTTFSRMTGPARSLSFSFDSGYLVGGCDEGRGLDIAHVASGDYVHHIDCGPAPVVQFSPRDYSLAYGVHEKEGGLRILAGPGLS